MAMDLINIISLAAGIALFIMSTIIRASAAKITGETETEATAKRDISRTSNILLLIGLIVVGGAGFKVYKDFVPGVQAAQMSYYF